MGIFGKRHPDPTPEEWRQVHGWEVEAWHAANPLRTFKVHYALEDGTVGGDEKVQAHRVVLEAVDDAQVFMFQRITPQVGYSGLGEHVVAPLIVPFGRVHSINMDMEEEVEHGAAAAGQPG